MDDGRAGAVVTFFYRGLDTKPLSDIFLCHSRCRETMTASVLYARRQHVTTALGKGGGRGARHRTMRVGIMVDIQALLSDGSRTAFEGPKQSRAGAWVRPRFSFEYEGEV